MAFPVNSTPAWLAMLLAILPLNLTAEGAPYTIAFEGNTRVAEARLVEVMERERPILERDFRDTALDDAAFMLELFYRELGYPEARVTFEAAPDRRAAVFRIQEGPEIHIRNLRITGATEIPEIEIRRRIESALGHTATGELRYVPEQLDMVASELRRRYESTGHLNAHTIVHVTTISPDTLDIQFDVKEGPAFFLRSLRLTGEVIAREDEIFPDRDGWIGELWTPESDSLLVSRALDAYRNRGHYDATAEALTEINAETGAVDVTLLLQAGPAYRIGDVRIEIEPPNRTRPQSVRRRLRLREGDLFRQDRADRALRRLLLTGAFSDARIHAKPAGDGVLDLRVALREARAKRLSLLVGYGSWDGPRGRLKYADSNFLGSLYRSRVEVFGSARSFGGEIALADPLFLNLDLLAEIKAFSSYREQPSFSVSETGGQLLFERRWRTRQLTGLQFLNKRVFDTSTSLVGVELPPPEYSLGSVQLSHRWDKRNDVLNPSSGFYLEGRVELASQALLGDLEFVRWGGRASYYQPLTRNDPVGRVGPFFVLAMQFGALQTFGGTDLLPVQERFYNGGATTVRSFAEDELGPRDRNGTPIGGRSFAAATAELQVPLYRDLFLATFVDAGTLSEGTQVSPGTDTRYALGAGLRYYTPIGALRLDYGWNPERRQGEDAGALHFSLGLTF